MTTGRFAPSPTGELHLGNLRTALLAWCFARHDGGSFLVRVEDLTTGAEPIGEGGQLRDLALIGLHHDGEIMRQSDRTDRYDEVIEQLGVDDGTYPCFCSRREIREASAAPHGPADDGAYPGTCASLTGQERRRRIKSGRRPALRLRAGSRSVTVQDRFAGSVTAAVDDFVLRRADGVAAYNLAVVVDDSDQGVDQVVRGDDLLDTTPRQVLLQQLLGLATPEYVHVPLVLGPDGERLSKRHGAVSLGDRMALGETPESVIGRLAESAGILSTPDPATASEVLERFDPTRVASAAWVMDRAPIGPA